MGRPPRNHLAKPTREEAAFLSLMAMGVCGWSLVIEALIVLERKKIISDKQCRKIIIGAAAGLKGMDERSPHPIIQLAVSLMEGQVEGWDRVEK
jgi:hypothetical protein